ncbi:MAG: hypothetical protein K2O12_06925, partial [Muribaculaceae bacterium]|nr:hypothetical protein [Muribaculaceae bacterium]
YNLVYDGFMSFFTRNISKYDYIGNPLSFVGSTAITYSEVLHKAAADFGAEIHTIQANSMPGLIEFHAKD